MAGTTKRKAEYGDFQTPLALAQSVCAHLAHLAVQPAALLEPTCGIGTFLFAALDKFKGVGEASDWRSTRRSIARAENALRTRHDSRNVRLMQADFFATDWRRVIDELPEPVLVLGNPPWVTNSQLGTLKSRNVPVKSNFQGHDGLDAITGKANFDISEWMLIQLLEALDGRQGALAMLCKSATAQDAKSCLEERARSGTSCYLWHRRRSVF